MFREKQKRWRRVSTEVARLLAEERVRAGLSMSAVAERGGLSQQMVSYVEREIRNPTLSTLIRMADAIGVDLADVIREAVKRSSGQMPADFGRRPRAAIGHRSGLPDNATAQKHRRTAGAPMP